jgi:hypothetical protein
MRHKKGDDMHERKKDTNTVAHDWHSAIQNISIRNNSINKSYQWCDTREIAKWEVYCWWEGVMRNVSFKYRLERIQTNVEDMEVKHDMTCWFMKWMKA